MGHFAKVGALTEPLAYHPKVLSTLKRLVSCYHRTSFAAVPIEARLNALWTIANLACNVENMVMMACHPGLIIIPCSIGRKNTLINKETNRYRISVIFNYTIEF